MEDGWTRKNLRFLINNNIGAGRRHPPAPSALSIQTMKRGTICRDDLHREHVWRPIHNVAGKKKSGTPEGHLNKMWMLLSVVNSKWIMDRNGLIRGISGGSGSEG